MHRSIPMRSIARRLLVLAVVLCSTRAWAQRGEPIPQQLTFTPYHASGIYDVGETVGWTVTSGPVAPTYKYRWTIRRNNAVVLKQAMLDLSTGKAIIEIAAGEPGMIYVAVEAFDDLTQTAASSAAGVRRFIGGNAGRNDGFYAVGAAVAPGKIGLATPTPADFNRFWQDKLDAQAKIPINPVLLAVETDMPGVELRMFQ